MHREIFFLDLAYELLTDLQACVKATDDEMVVGIKEHQLFTTLRNKELNPFIAVAIIKQTSLLFSCFPWLLILFMFLTECCCLSSPILFLPLPPSSSLLILFLIHQRKERLKKRKNHGHPQHDGPGMLSPNSLPIKSTSAQHDLSDLIWRRFFGGVCCLSAESCWLWRRGRAMVWKQTQCEASELTCENTQGVVCLFLRVGFGFDWNQRWVKY